MEELSPLFQEIEFHERFRGYDPDEVDAYVDRVAKAAALVQGRLTALAERAEAAEARLVAAGGGEAESTLTRTLVLAQRTADAAIAEAREEAERLLADAEAQAQAAMSGAEAEAAVTLREAGEQASRILEAAERQAHDRLEEAETERRALVETAEKAAAEAAAAERERLAGEVAELQQFRAFLADDVEILERHLTEQRHQLAVSLSALTDLLESPDIFRRRDRPPTSGVEVDPALLRVELDQQPPGHNLDESMQLDESVQEGEPAEPTDAEIESPADDEIVDTMIVLDAPGVAEEPSEDAGPPLDLTEEPAAVPGTHGANESEGAVAATDTATDDTKVPIEPEIVFEEVIGATAAAPAVAADAATDDAEVPADDEIVFEEVIGGDVGLIDLDAPPADVLASAGAPAYAETSGRPRLVTAADIDAGGSPTRPLADAEDGGPPTAPIPALEEQALFDDPGPAEDSFLAQLRDAVAEVDEPDRNEDAALSAFFDQDDDDGGRSWFGRRR